MIPGVTQRKFEVSAMNFNPPSHAGSIVFYALYTYMHSRRERQTYIRTDKLSAAIRCCYELYGVFHGFTTSVSGAGCDLLYDQCEARFS